MKPPDRYQERPWDLIGQMGRRRFLKLLGASMAALGLSACNREPSFSLPYVMGTESVTPGERQFFATALPYRGFGRGVLVESVMGRPVKVDGNPDHPASLGGSDAAMQATLLDLYDPDRPRMVRRPRSGSREKGVPGTLAEFFEKLSVEAARFEAVDGRGLHILTETITSPSLQSLLDGVLSKFPEAGWHRFQAFSGRLEGTRGPLQVHYHLSEADLILSFDEDFLGEHPHKVRYAHDFGLRRAPDRMNQLWVAESTVSLTGANADHRFAGTPAQLNRILASLLAGEEPKELPGVFRALQANPGRSLVMGGDGVDASLVHRLNQKLGNLGRTVTYSKSVDSHPLSASDSLARLQGELEAGEVELLLVLGGDPVYLSGNSLDPGKARTSLHLTAYRNATSASCDWTVPSSHPLESWGDTASWDGTLSLIQPLIKPLHACTDAYELLGTFLGRRRSAYEQVRAYWHSAPPGALKDEWENWLREGVVRKPEERVESTGVPAGSSSAPLEPGQDQMLVRFRHDPYFDDGKNVNNPWLLEMGRPITRLAWNNAAMVSERWAREHRLEDGDHIEVTTAGGKLVVPIFRQPDHPEKVVTLTLGWGQHRVGRFGSGKGYDAYPLRGAETRPYVLGTVRRAEGHTDLISVQHHREQDGRELARHASLREFHEEPGLGIPPPPENSLYPEKEESAHRRWGMVIDLTKCIGCNACVAACSAENNIPVVGPRETKRGRAMHWLRVDRYEEGQGIFQPVPCMHCENAPCEQVCPVEATLHSKEGLNQMVYNRCVGTRYCSNNCPYEVRRFNFFDYTNSQIEEWKLARNPDVTVRSRGVMEKCTYCVQRIEAADIRARVEEREIRDGEVRTACQTACPTKAIVFGDLGDPESEVNRLARLPHNYGMLEELNTRPRTTYLAQIRNLKNEGPA